jgi:NAD(P)H-quinone oxidoreductase subunit 5
MNLLLNPFFVETTWLIPFYPFLGMLLSALWLPSITQRTGPRPAGYLNLLMTLLAFLHSILAFLGVWHQPPRYLSLPWLHTAGFELSLPLEISSITIAALILITGLNLLAQFYAVGYLEMDWGWARFFVFLALFEGGMCTLVLCNSLFFSYVVLEILTLGTYLIIGVWFNQSLVVTGARDAFLTKRVGDLFLLMGVLAIYPLAGTWNFTELAQWAQQAQEQANFDPKILLLLGLALLAGPMGKCAQFPFHRWLDEAMEGPVPSTVLRNSVVVATGAWVLIKLAPVLALSPQVLTVIISIGAATAVGGTLIAIAQIDVKRALSYSVSAYMGLIFIAVGTQQIEAAFLLILSHAVAMALLVMSAGSIILNTVTQDLTQLGGLWSRRPMTGLSYVVGAAGLTALPPLGGFWAELKLGTGLWHEYPLLLGVLLLVNSLTALSLTREFCLIFLGKPQQMTQRSPENLWTVTFPMLLLVGFTIHTPLILHSLDLLPHWSLADKPLIWTASLLTGASLMGGLVGFSLYLNPAIPKPIQLPFKPLQDLFAYDLYTPSLYKSTVVLGVDKLSRLTDWFDRYFVDGLVNFVGLASLFGGTTLKYGNTGQTRFYALTIFSGILLLVALITWQFLHLSLR